MPTRLDKSLNWGIPRYEWHERSWDIISTPVSQYKWYSGSRRAQRLGFAALSALVVATAVNFWYLVLPKEIQLTVSELYQQWGPFESVQLSGFLNSGLPGPLQTCDTLRYNSTIGVQKSRHISDNLEQIALSLDSHPAITYSDALLDNPDLSVAEIVNKTWGRLSGSSIWLPEQHVFMLVTRVVFLADKGIISAPKASFLRAQIFDESWRHLENYTLHWSTKSFTFPTVFDIPTKYEGGDGEFYGPEDPRIIIEDGVRGAEPVIIFNMAHERSDWKRAMYSFRPFSDHLTILTIRDEPRPNIEKNWTPFFLPSDDYKSKSSREPNEYIHFIYAFKPLKILKCHLRCGDCDFVFNQQLPENFLNSHDESGSVLNGGTNFVSVPIPKTANLYDDVRVHVGFPRTNVGRWCGTKFGKHYRPEFTVMISFRSQFYLAFASRAMDFGSAILQVDADDDPCDVGRILIPMSVSKWDTEQDVMTITVTVDDVTVQVTTVRGLFSFVLGLPQFKDVLNKKSPLKGQALDVMNYMSSWLGDDVRGCSVESAINSTNAVLQMHSLLFPDPPEPDEVDHSMGLTIKKEDENKQT